MFSLPPPHPGSNQGLHAPVVWQVSIHCYKPGLFPWLFSSFHDYHFWTVQVWWLISCVHLTQQQDTPVSGWTLFLGVSMRWFLENMSVWSHDPNKADGPSFWEGTLPSPQRASSEQGGQREVETNLDRTAELRHWSSALGTPSSQALALRGECTPWLSRFRTLNYTVAFLGLQVADDRSWDFSAFIIM